jgi:alpha-D-ribose 1-methylphosphonate 5-triphosphate synthase subunit PhnL
LIQNKVLKASHSGKCLDVANASTKNGESIMQFDCHGGDNQRVTYVPASGQIKFKHSGKCLDVATASNKNGEIVQQWDCHNGDNQKWDIDANV